MEKFKKKGFDFSDDKDGMFLVKMSFKELKDIQNWEEIGGISDGPAKLSSDIASAKESSGIAEVGKRNITGSGINVAQIENGGRVAPGNPPGVTQDPYDVCATPDDHATHVAGVIKSINLANTGTAPSVNLWASGACDGNIDKLWEKIHQAATIRNSNVINLSVGCKVADDWSCTRYPNQYARAVDGLAFSNNPFLSTIIQAADNNNAPWPEDGDHTGNIYGIGTAYNVITVGSYVDNNNSDSSDDVMSYFSSWKNPISYNGDREKPDVVAPGSNIITTGYSSPAMDVSGTSFSAPVVTGGSALLMQRFPNFRYEPEALKALIIATASNNIEGDLIPWYYEDSRDGFGGADFNLADRVMLGQVNGSQTARDYYCDSSAIPYSIPMNVTNTNIHRIALTWKVNPNYPNYDMQPNMDLDFKIRDPYGNWVGESGYLDSNVEAEYIRQTVTGTYTISITPKRCISGYTYTRLGVAWSEVPSLYTAEYFNNIIPSGSPAVTRKDPKIAFDWGGGSPDSAISSDRFSARWTKTEYLEAGTYTFTATGDDGIKLWVDGGTPLIDKWIDQGPTTYTATKVLSAGNHTIKFEYYENGGGAVAKMGYERMAPIVSGGIYRLVNQCSGKVVDVSGGSTADNANVHQWGWVNVGQQKWKITSLSGGYYRLTPQHSTSKALEVYGNVWYDGGNVVQYTWNGGSNQQWELLNVGAGFAKVVNRLSGRALDVSYAGLNDGANIWQCGYNGSCAQRWRLDKL